MKSHDAGHQEDIGDVEVQLLAKFVGLGSYGLEKLRRAQRLADLGFGPPVLGLAYGFIVHPFLASFQPMSTGDLSDAVMARMVDYYASIANDFSKSPEERLDTLLAILEKNAGEGLGLELSGLKRKWLPFRDTIDRLPLVQIDGKPQPHEWLMDATCRRSEIIKADSSDHFLDHTLIGEQSILWDLAGVCEEWEMDGNRLRQFLALWEQKTGDRSAANLLDFFRAVYLAFRIAAMHYAIYSTDEDDIRRSLQNEQWRYGQRLKKLIAEQTSTVNR